MSAEGTIASFLRLAQEDLDGAQTLSSTGNRNAFYLCAQAAEKLIRAVLTSEGKHGGIKHQLQDMVDLVPDENPLKPLLREIEPLAAFLTSYRYPTNVGRIRPSPKKAAFDDFANNVKAGITEAATRFGVDMTSKDSPAANSSPIR